MLNKATYALWAIQGLLALVFLAAGGMKLVVPAEAMQAQMPVALPVLLIRAIGVAELLGAAGLVLPGLLRVRVGLTPVAAGCLVIHMAGATGFTMGTMGLATAVMPAAVALLAAAVAYGRLHMAPLTNRASARRVAALQAAA